MSKYQEQIILNLNHSTQALICIYMSIRLNTLCIDCKYVFIIQYVYLYVFIY